MDREYWDRLADSFDEDVFSVPASDLKQRIDAHLPRRRSKGRPVACDFGCGVGRVLARLSRTHTQVIAADLSQACLEEAARRHAGLDNIEYHVWDMANDPKPFEGTADFGVCINVLIMPAPAVRAAILKAIVAAMSPGGKLLLTVPSLESVLLTVNRLTNWNVRDGMSHEQARSEAWDEVIGEGDIADGIVTVGGTPTKHWLKEGLGLALGQAGLKPVKFAKIEYAWTTEFESPPRWMQEPLPWGWLVICRRPSH